MYVNWLNHKEYDLSVVEKKLETSKRRNHFTNTGPLVTELECYLKEILKVDKNKRVFMAANGTAALHAIVSAINLKKGRDLKYATQDFTFPSSVLGPMRDAQVLDMTSEHEVQIPSLDVDGLVITNVFGNSLDVSVYEDWAKANDKVLIIDNAATPYTFYKGKNSINYGTASFISLHHTKPLGFGEGGFIIIDEEYAYEVERVLNFGFDANRDWNTHGSNFRMSDISAAFIFQHVEKNFYNMVSHHRELREAFYEVAKHNEWQLWNDKSDGDPFLSSLLFFSDKAENEIKNLNRFEWKRYYKPLQGLPQSSEIYSKIHCLPCHSEVRVKDILSLKQ